MIKLSTRSFAFLTAALIFAGCAADTDLESSSKVATEVAEVLQQFPEAVQISDNQVAWNDGKVVLTIPDETKVVDAEAEARVGTVHGCPRGWFCFYQHDNWGGRRLQFSDCSSGGVSQYLRDYGFENQTTSWVANKNLNFVNVNDFTSGYNLWNEDGNSSSSNVGAWANDKADWFICYL